MYKKENSAVICKKILSINEGVVIVKKVLKVFLSIKSILGVMLMASILALTGCVGNKRNDLSDTQQSDVLVYPSQPTTVEETIPVIPDIPTYTVESLQDVLESRIGERVYFAYDQYSLTQGARETLDAQASLLNDNQEATVRIAGNCDERGTREYNLALGARRAQSVKDYLVSLGVSSSRIKTVSYGKERPLDDRSNATAWARNRNAETKVVSMDSYQF